MDFNTEIYAGNILGKLRDYFSMPDLTIGEVYAILRWNKIEPLRSESRKNGEKTYVYPKYKINGLLKNFTGLMLCRERIIQNRKDAEEQRQQREREIYNDVMQDMKARDLENGDKGQEELTPYQKMQQASDECLRNQEVYFNDSNDDRLYESLFGKKVYFTEEQVKYIQDNLLLEGDSRLKAVDRIIDSEFSGLLNPDGVVRGEEYYVNGNPQTTWRQYILYSLRHTFGLMTNADVQYLPLVAKLAFGNEVQFEKTNDNGRQIALLQKIVMLLKKQPELFQQLNKQRDSITFSQVYELLKSQIEAIEQSDAESANQIQQRNDYDIVEVPDFETANYYGDYSCSESKLCYTQGENTWESYKGYHGQNRVYVCLKKGWENIPEQAGEGNPYDEYGTSMIFVFINPEGDIETSNCRWNHHVEGQYIGDVDHAFTKTSLAETVGRNFSETFKPYSKDELHQMGVITFDEIPELLAQGANLEDIFNSTYELSNGYTVISFNGKYNLINTKRELVSPDQWFDRIDDFYDGYAPVMMRHNGHKWNCINAEGKLIWNKPIDEWFDNVYEFHEGRAIVRLNHKYNYLTTKGEILSPNQWFDYALWFDGGIACVKLNGEHNFLDRTGELISEQWFDWIGNFWRGYARVQLNSKYNFINRQGGYLLPNQWLDWADEFKNDEFTRIQLNGSFGFININGELDWDVPLQEFFDYFSDDFFNGFAMVRLNYNDGDTEKCNLIDKNHKLVLKRPIDEWPYDIGLVYNNGIAIARLNNKYNYISTKKGDYLSPNMWFDYAYNFKDGFGLVSLNDKLNYINAEGKLLWDKPVDQWFNHASRFNNGYAEVVLNGEYYFLRDDGVLCNYDGGEPVQNLNENKTILTEDRGSKNLHQVRAYIQQQRPNFKPEYAQQVIDALRHDIPNIRLPRINNTDYYQFALGVARMYLNGELSDADTILNLNNVLKYVASNAHIKEYDKNLNDLTAKELINRFSGIVAQDIEQNKQQLSKQQFNKSDYEIVPINDFETAEQYGEYVSWCVTHDDGMYNNYTHNGMGRFYFCLKPGFENVPEEKGENCPLDTYGLSMIAVSINPDGSPNTITCRWNHDNGGNDSVMTPEELSNVIGHNFYDVFKPYTEEEMEEKHRLLIDNFKYHYSEDGIVTDGESWDYIDNPDKENKWSEYRVVTDEDMYGDISGYGVVVMTDGDYNEMADPGNSRLVIDEVFDFVSSQASHDGLIAVGFGNQKTNYLNITTGEYVTDKWFIMDETCDNFRHAQRRMYYAPILDESGVIIKELDGTYNILMSNGERFVKDWQTHAPIKMLKLGLYVVSDGLAKLRVYNTLTNQTQDLHGLPNYGLVSSDLVILSDNGYNYIYKIVDNSDTLVVPLNKNIPAVALLGFYSFTNNDGKIVNGYKIEGKDNKDYILDLDRIGDVYHLDHPNPNNYTVYTVKYLGNTLNKELNIMNENKKRVYFTESQMRYINEKIINHPETKYIENDYDEKWEKLPINSDIYKTIDRKTSFKNKCYSKIGLMDVAEVREEDVEDGGGVHYIAMFHGGLNGSGEWDKYLKDIVKIMQSINGSYIIKLDVDVPDDVWTLTIGFRKEKLNEGASGYQPEDSDAYFDTCYKISEELFKDLLKKLDKCYRDKNDNMIYTYLGIINHLLQVECLRKPVYYSNKDLTSKNPEGNPLGMNIIKTCLKCYKYLESDNENRQGWKDFERYKEELYGQYHIFKMTMQTLNQDANIYPNYLYHLNESVNFVDPKKVLLVKEFLDDNFVRAAIPVKTGAGDLKKQAIVAVKGLDGQPAENMTLRKLFWKTQDHFQKIYADKTKRDAFIKQVIIDWYNKKITKEGLLSTNQY